jgi:two-component system CheB/CheR fusion protein
MHPLADVLLQLWLGGANQEHALLLLDTHGRVVGGAGPVEPTLGRSVESLRGQPLTVIFTPEDRAAGIDRLELETAAVSGRSIDDRWHVRLDGARVWITGTLDAIRDENGQLLGFVKVLRDRTDMRVQIETLERRVDALAQADQARKLFLATLGHELRNPLAALTNGVQLIRLMRGDERLREPLKLMERQMALLTRMADDLLDATRSDTGRLRLQRIVLPLQGAVEALLRTWQPRASARGLALESRLPEAEVVLYADPARFEQMVGNLLHNAIKHTPAGGRVWLKGSVEGGMAVLRVEDNGEGIDAALLPRLFELFTQGPESAAAREAGLGLGLPLVKGLAEAHGGLVEVRSAGRGRGSEFTLRLPLHAPAEAPDAPGGG